MKPRVFPPGRVGIVADRLAIDVLPIATCATARKPVPLRRREAMPLVLPATALSGEKIHRLSSGASWIGFGMACQVDGFLVFSLIPDFAGTAVSPCGDDKTDRPVDSLNEDGQAWPLPGVSRRAVSLDRGGDSSVESRKDLKLSFGLATAFEFVTGLVTGLVRGLANGLDVAPGVRLAIELDVPIRCCDGRGLRCPGMLSDNLSAASLSAWAHASLGLRGLDTARCLVPGLAGAFEGDHGRTVSASF